MPTYTGLNNFDPERDLLRLPHPDDLSDCYSQLYRRIQALKTQHPNGRFQADYTGGTKTMSAALAMAALDSRVTLFLTTRADRTNLTRVETGEATTRARSSSIQLDSLLTQRLPQWLSRFDYGIASAELRALLAELELEPEQSRLLKQLQDCCIACDAWDRFDHREAWQRLSAYLHIPQLKNLGLYLKRVIASRACLDPAFPATEGISGHGYEIVEDLLLNAQRRERQQRYDDAVGRLYRALELLAQLRLKQAYGIATGNVELDKIPVALQNRYRALQGQNRESKLQLSLIQSYELLVELDDQLGKLYKTHKSEILNALQVRNHSLFAHGFSPIQQIEYRRFNSVVCGLIEAAIICLATPQYQLEPIQLPTSLPGLYRT